MVEQALERAIAALLAQSGRGDARFALAPYPVSGNNRVYRVELPEETLVAKWYFSHPSDPRDRLGAETALLQYAAAADIGCVPRVVATSREHNLALYSHLRGKTPGPEEIDQAHMDAAARFFRNLNELQARRHAESLPLAADACLSIAAHLKLLERRIARIAAIAPASDLDAEALRFAESIRARCADLKAEALAGAKSLRLDPDKPLTPIMSSM